MVQLKAKEGSEFMAHMWLVMSVDVPMWIERIPVNQTEQWEYQDMDVLVGKPSD